MDINLESVFPSMSTWSLFHCMNLQYPLSFYLFLRHYIILCCRFRLLKIQGRPCGCRSGTEWDYDKPPGGEPTAMEPSTGASPFDTAGTMFVFLQLFSHFNKEPSFCFKRNSLLWALIAYQTHCFTSRTTNVGVIHDFQNGIQTQTRSFVKPSTGDDKTTLFILITSWVHLGTLPTHQ